MVNVLDGDVTSAVATKCRKAENIAKINCQVEVLTECINFDFYDL
jgi:hypothetical protein